MLVAAHPFGELLDQIMRDHDLTQYELGKQLGYSGQAFISHVRGGRKRPPLNMAAKIAREFPEHDEFTVYGMIKDARARMASLAGSSTPGLLNRLFPARLEAA